MNSTLGVAATAGLSKLGGDERHSIMVVMNA
jgi:hypothetical protein